MRCFVAVDLSAAVREAVARAQADLRQAAPRADVRWTDASAFHLTLKFLGEVAETSREAVEEALAGATAGHPVLALSVDRLGGFPSARRPRVVWAGLGGGVALLRQLAAAIETAVAPLGFPPECRPFQAHVTLARVRSPRGLDRLAQALEAAATTRMGQWSADAVVLYRSHLRPTGAIHEPLAHFELGRPNP